MSIDVESFRLRLEEAFPDEGCPDNAHTTCDCPECTDLVAFLKKRRYWRRFSAHDCWTANMTSLMWGAFDYFLPAYMLASLVDSETADGAVDFAAWRFLEPKFDDSLFDPPEKGLIRVPREEREASRLPDIPRFMAFTPEQRMLILEWLTEYARTQSVDEDQEADYLRQIRQYEEAGQRS